MKDPADVEECKKILLQNFAYIKIAYVEGLAGSPASYPEVGAAKFISQMLECQETDEEKARLSRAQIETSYIRATKGDKATGLGGTLCRGELLEILLRLCAVSYPKGPLHPHLQGFLDVYIKPQYERSTVLRDRNALRESRKLN